MWRGLTPPRAPVYQAPGTPVTILQRRAPHLKVSPAGMRCVTCTSADRCACCGAVQGHSHAFVAELVAWAKKAGFSQVLVATGADAGHRTDIQLTGWVWMWAEGGGWL